MNKDKYYDSKRVAKTRSSYYCNYCHGTIKKGDPCDVHTINYDGEFGSERTHIKCSKKYFDEATVTCPECGEEADFLVLDKMCEDCVKNSSPVNAHIIY